MFKPLNESTAICVPKVPRNANTFSARAAGASPTSNPAAAITRLGIAVVALLATPYLAIAADANSTEELGFVRVYEVPADLTAKDSYRTVVVLRHFSDFSYREISDILQIPEKTVKSRLYSARQLMKQSLQSRGVY